MFLGATVSISGGFDKCIDRITKLGGNTLMTFASSPRSLKTRDFPQQELIDYQSKKKRYQIGPHFFHAVYLVNLASESHDYLKSSINSLIFYQRFAGKIGAVGTIVHIGSHKGRGLPETISQIVAAINFILDSSPKDTRLILENTAGHSGTIGATFDELAQIINRVGDKSKIGICLDTQHAFASGYPLDTAINQLAKSISLKHLSIIHFNDSKSDFNSHLDRHANLGQGKIGLENLKNFATDPRLSDIPLILEVPGSGHTGPRKSDVDLLRALVVE
jgi:apurinic endonuclease APN1